MCTPQVTQNVYVWVIWHALGFKQIKELLSFTVRIYGRHNFNNTIKLITIFLILWYCRIQIQMYFVFAYSFKKICKPKSNYSDTRLH